MSGYESFRATGKVEPGVHGRVKVELAVPASTAASAALLAVSGNGNFRVGEEITMLFVGGKMVMSDTHDEWRDHQQRWP